MPRGQADFGMYAPQAYVGSLSDMAELAVRLGSIDIFDRRGKVIDFDDCEGTLFKWFVTLPGDAAAVFDHTNPKSGSQSIKLTSGTVGLSAALIEKRFPPLVSQREGIECCFSQPSTDIYLDIQLIYHDGVNSHSGKLRLDFNAKIISYLSGALTYTNILTVSEFHAGAFIYYPMKLVVDFSTGYHVRLLFAGQEYDLSAYPLYVTASASAPHVSYGVASARRTGTGGDLYLDDFIFTQEEP